MTLPKLQYTKVMYDFLAERWLVAALVKGSTSRQIAVCSSKTNADQFALKYEAGWKMCEDHKCGTCMKCEHTIECS